MNSILRIFVFVFQHPKFEAIVEGLNFQKRGTGGEDTDAVDDVYDISNKARIKKTEVHNIVHWYFYL